jgi:hypothetical protein
MNLLKKHYLVLGKATANKACRGWWEVCAFFKHASGFSRFDGESLLPRTTPCAVISFI